MAVLTRRYPTSKYEGRTLVDLTDDAERERLTPAAWRGFLALAEEWDLTDDEARSLLGGVASSTFYSWRSKDAPPTFDVDRLTRLSYLVGIYKALHLLWDTSLANRWVKMANQNPMFAGSTPLEHMRTGGILAMADVRALLDARRSGP